MEDWPGPWWLGRWGSRRVKEGLGAFPPARGRGRQWASHLGLCEHLPALQLSHLDQGSHHAHISTGGNSDPVAVSSCSQSQASSAASDEVIQGVVRLFSDLGTDAGGDAKYGTNSSCSKGVPSCPGHSFQEGVRRLECDAIGRGDQACRVRGVQVAQTCASVLRSGPGWGQDPWPPDKPSLLLSPQCPQSRSAGR